MDIIVFMHDADTGARFGRKVQSYLQPDRVVWSWVVETPEASTEIMGSRMSRSLLVLDSEVLAQREDFLWGFAQRGAFGLIAILYAHDAANIPLSAPLPGAIVLHYPVDDDSWLLMMHQLLDLAN